MSILRPIAHHSLSGALAFIMLTLSACGGGGGGGTSTSNTATASASSATNTSAATSASSAAASASSSRASTSSASSSVSTSVASSATSGIYVATPIVSSCDPGQLKDSERVAVLSKLNLVRARHGLPAVTYDNGLDSATAEAAMYMVANKTLTHSPVSSGLCYTANAATLSSQSNLHMTWTTAATTQNIASSDAIIAYLVDSDVSSLGHRRWVLYPFLSKTTYGRVDGQPSGTTGQYMASALKVIGNAASTVSMSNDFVAYPYGNYPASEFSTSWFLSFSAVASKTNPSANGSGQVSYGSASIAVKMADGTTLSISEQSFNYDGYGLANNLQWKVTGLQSGVDYTVTISNVIVNGAAREFTYNFRLD